eukprot:932381-Rhodomonas_salina.1
MAVTLHRRDGHVTGRCGHLAVTAGCKISAITAHGPCTSRARLSHTHVVKPRCRATLNQLHVVSPLACPPASASVDHRGGVGGRGEKGGERKRDRER